MVQCDKARWFHLQNVSNHTSIKIIGKVCCVGEYNDGLLQDPETKVPVV